MYFRVFPRMRTAMSYMMDSKAEKARDHVYNVVGVNTLSSCCVFSSGSPLVSTNRPSLALSGPCVMNLTPSIVPRRSPPAHTAFREFVILHAIAVPRPVATACSPYLACFTVLHLTIAPCFILPCPFVRRSWPSHGATTPIPFYRSVGLYPPGEFIDLVSFFGEERLLPTTCALSLCQFNKGYPHSTPSRSSSSRRPSAAGAIWETVGHL